MRKTKPGLSALFSVTYVSIVIAVLAIITLSVSTYMGRFFISVREQEQTEALEKCAAALTPYIESSDPNHIYEILSSYAIDCNGRILFIDEYGCVQADTFCRLNGTHPESAEISAILEKKQDSSTGYHKLRLSETAITKDNEYLQKSSGSYWCGYYSKAIVYSGQQCGLLLLSAPIDDIVGRVLNVERWLIVFDVLFTFAVGAITLYLSHSLTRSVQRFNRAIGRMTGGDFSVRVDENEMAEFGALAKAFNMMSEKLENLDASRNQFVSDASHELKTPLASMKILSESLLTQSDAPIELYREFMNDINSEVDRLSLVINDLLTLVKTDKGAETLIIVPVELGALIKRITGTVAPLAKKKHITVSFEYVDVTVMADELRMQQLFTNLIDNAIKYSPEKTTVTVTLSQTLGNAVVSVSDQGIGISKDDLAHVFERFFRVDKARSRQAGGTGLGLSIVKQITDQHGGTVEAKSEPGHGTTFTVSLPLPKKESNE